MEVSTKIKSETTNRKLFAFLNTTAKLEKKIEIASKILLQSKENNKITAQKYSNL